MAFPRFLACKVSELAGFERKFSHICKRLSVQKKTGKKTENLKNAKILCQIKAEEKKTKNAVSEICKNLQKSIKLLKLEEKLNVENSVENVNNLWLRIRPIKIM